MTTTKTPPDLSPEMTEFRRTFTENTLQSTRNSFSSIIAMLEKDPALRRVANEMRTASIYITRAETLLNTK